MMKGCSAMLKKTKHCGLFFIASFVCIAMGWNANAALSETLTVDQIIQNNIAARGGAQAWHAIQSMKLTGKMDAGGKNDAQLPFVLKLERPRKLRLEIDFAKSTALQIYDGANGWKVRPFLGRLQVEPYTAEEREIAAEQSDLDGFLIDHAAKGIKAELVGKEMVEDREAYKLKLTLKDGQTRSIWLDAQTFLELKIEGSPRKLDGKMHNVETYYRDYRTIDGVTIPFTLETIVEKVQGVRKISFESVAFNPAFDSAAFSRPDVRGMKPATVGLRANALQVQPPDGAPWMKSVKHN
jgi:hypothetical protein